MGKRELERVKLEEGTCEEDLRDRREDAQTEDKVESITER